MPRRTVRTRHGVGRHPNPSHTGPLPVAALRQLKNGLNGKSVPAEAIGLSLPQQ